MPNWSSEKPRLLYIANRYTDWRKELKLDEEWALKDGGFISLDALVRYKLGELRKDKKR